MEEAQYMVLVMEVTNLNMEAPTMEAQDLSMEDKEATRPRNQVIHCPLFLSLVLVTTAGSTVLQTGTMKTLESIIGPTTITLTTTPEVTDKDPDIDLIMFTMMKEIEGMLFTVTGLPNKLFHFGHAWT